MSSSDGSTAEDSVQRIYEHALSSSSSTVEPPMEEWSSLVHVVKEDPPKVVLYKQGLFDPGSKEICTKYIAMSDSSVLRHSYYKYPNVKNPGIETALLDPECKESYHPAGRQLYLDLCKNNEIIPVMRFHHSLMEEEINLKYYCVNPKGVWAMCEALRRNPHVRRLDLTANYLNEDACFHLGKLIGESSLLKELILSGCRISATDVEKIVHRLDTANMELLDLSKNGFGDEGFLAIAEKIKKRAVIKRLNLSQNKLGLKTALSFAQALEYNNSITHLDLSWNQLYMPRGSTKLLQALGLSRVLVELNLSWNGLATLKGLDDVLTIPTLHVLDLSNNRLTSETVNLIVSNLHHAKKLHILDLSFNPLAPADALKILMKMRVKGVKLKNLLMEDIGVSVEFAQKLKEILALRHLKQTKITHGRVIRNYQIVMPDMRDIVMKRLQYLTSIMKKKPSISIVIYFHQKCKLSEVLLPGDMLIDMKAASAPVGEDLIFELAKAFPGPRIEGAPTISLKGVVGYASRLWPGAPTTPPPVAAEAAPAVIHKKRAKKKKQL